MLTRPGSGKLRQQLLACIFQDSPEFQDLFSRADMTAAQREQEMTRLEPEFKHWKTIYNATHVRGRTLLFTAYQQVRVEPYSSILLTIL